MARAILLRDIVDPTTEHAFFENSWTRAPLVLKRADPGHFGGLFDLEDLETFLFAVRPPLGQVELFRDGEAPPAETLAELFDEANYGVQSLYNAMSAGYTIVLNAVHQRWPAVRRLVTDLEDQLCAAGQTNIYVTGTSSQGFAPHVDDHDVFVLQTHGRKRWYIHDRPENHPGRREPPLLHEVEIEQGDSIYIPRGFPHFAETSSDFSIHLAVGIYPYTWFKLFTDLLAEASVRDPSWHDPVSLRALKGESPLPAMDDIRRKLMTGVEKVERSETIFERYRGWLSASDRRKSPPPGGYLRSVRAADEIDQDTPIVRRHGVGCSVTSTGISAVIHFLGDSINAPKHVEVALRFIARETAFHVKDLPGLSDNSKLVLVRRLIREGLLQLADRHQG